MNPVITTKVVNLRVPNDFQLPLWYTDALPSQRALALKLGADAAQIVQKKATDTVRQETHAEAIKQATAEFEVQIRETETAAAAVQQKLRSQLHRAEEALRVAQARIEAMETSATEQRQRAQKEARESAQELLEVKDSQIRQLQATLEKQLEAVTTKVETLQNSMTKTFSSSKEKGSFGEALMESFLKKAFDCDVQTVSKEPQTADITMTRRRGAKYLWEVKNYTRMVNPEEIEKFRRDMRLHPEVKAGVLVSLRQGIVGKCRGGDIDMEFLEDGRPMLFLSHFMAREDPVFALQSLRPLFDTIEMVARPQKGDTEAIRALEAKAMLITNLLRSHAQSLAKHKNAIAGHRKRMDSMFVEFQGFCMEAEAQLQALLRVAMGGEEATAAVQEETDTLLSAIVFRKGRLSECAEDRIKEFVKWLLGQAEAREGTQIECKDLLEKAKAAGFSEKWTRALREELFQETAWPKGSRWILGLRWLETGSAAGAAAAAH